MDFLIGLFEALGLYSAANGLGDHLQGLDLQCNDYTNQSIYSLIFMYLFGLSSIVLANYYYGVFNRVPFNKWGWWLLNVLASAIIIFFIAFIQVNNDFETNNYCKDLEITTSDSYGFALTAAIFSLIYSIILSYIIKWKSSANKTVNPFYIF